MDFINIIGTLFDNSIDHIVALAHQIKDLRLNKNQQDINEEYGNRLGTIENKIAAGDIGAKEKYKHQLITRSRYNSLKEYERNTLYLITDFVDETSVFGDTFPFILGGDSDASQFGDTFPFVLGGPVESTLPGGTFPITLD